MTRDELTRQVAEWARQIGTSPGRIQNYAERAGRAYDELAALAKTFAADFNKNNPQKVVADDAECGILAAAYNRELLNFKLTHELPADERIDTHICAGLWFCAIIQNPPFGCVDDGAVWDTAEQEQLDLYYRLVGHFAFRVAFQVLRGHFKRYEELYLLNILSPIRKYMVDHKDAIASSPAASVGIFHTISVFDRDCRVPSILS